MSRGYKKRALLFRGGKLKISAIIQAFDETRAGK